MKIRNYVVVIFFVVIITMVALEQKIIEKDISKKINNYEMETMDNLYNLTKLMLDYKVERLREISNYEFDSKKLNDLKLQIYNYSKEKETLDFYTDYVVILENSDEIITTIDENDDGSYFNAQEKDVLEDLYKKVKERLSLVYSEKFVESNNSYSLYFGTPLFNTNGEFIGIISTRFRSDNFDKFLTNIIGDSIFEFTMTQEGKEIYSNRIKLEKHLPNKLNNICEYEMYVPELNSIYYIKYNLYDGYTILYSSLILINIFPIAFTIYIYLLLRKKDKYVSFNIFTLILLTGLLVNTFNVVVHKIYCDKVTEMCEYTCSHIIYETINYQREKTTKSCIEFASSAQALVDATPNLNKDNYLNFVNTNLYEQFYTLLNQTNGLGHIYIYGPNKECNMYPINENFSYTTPNHEIYDSYSIHLGESYVEIEYDDNYQNDMMFYSYPIVKDNSLLFVITFVFDFNYIRDNIIKSIKNETMTLIYVQENNDMYKIENKKIEYVKKYGGIIEVFDSSKWTDSVKDKIYYQKYYDENEFYEKETIYSHYMNGLIYVSDNDRISFMDMIDRLIYSLITVGGLFTAVNWYYRRKEKNKNKK